MLSGRVQRVAGAIAAVCLVACAVVGHAEAAEAPAKKVRPLLVEHIVDSEVLQAFVPEAPLFADVEQLEAYCRGAEFTTSGGVSASLEDFREFALGFYASGMPKLEEPAIMDAMMRQRHQVAAACPHAIMQVILLRIEMLLLSVYMRSEQSRNDHLAAFSEASSLHAAFGSLKHWAASHLGGDMPNLGWPFEKGWGRVQRYYDVLWEDVFDSEDAWAVMEQPGQITDDQYHAAFDQVAEVLVSLGLEWWPCRGTLIALLRHGRRSGMLSRGLMDVVERDIDLMLGLPDEAAWFAIGKAIERELKAKGWDRCWTKTSADLGSNFRDATRRDLLYCVQTSPVYMLVDITTYIYGTPEPYVFVHRVCDNSSSSSDAEGRSSAGEGCNVPPDVGPLRPGGGILPKDAIYPLGRCRAHTTSVPCPRSPLKTIQAMIHSGLDAGCIALPTVRGRDPDDPWTLRLRESGLLEEDVRILRERSDRLEAMGFQSMSPFFEQCSGESLLRPGG